VWCALRMFCLSATARTIKLISANAYGTRAMVPYAKSTIALYTELHVQCDQQSAIGSRLQTALASSTEWLMGCCQHQTARCRCLYRTRRRSACRGEIFEVRSLGQSSRGKNPDFWRYPNFPKTRHSTGRGKTVRKKSAQFVQPFRYTIPACDRQTHDGSI